MNYTQSDGFEGGSRFYLSYDGSAPTAGNLNTLAVTVGSAWGSHIGPTVNSDWSLVLVDIVDIATVTGASGADMTTHTGSASGTPLAAQLANNVEFKIARRYRGGKPRMYLPPGVDADMLNPSQWTTGHVSGVTNAVGLFFGAIVGTGPGAMGTLAHVNLSYYSGFRNIANTSGRERAVPQYRSTVATVDPVTGYLAKQMISSQRRRRSATTP